MQSTEKKEYDTLLREESMMNGDFNKNKVHPDFLKTQPEPPKGCCSQNISCSTILYFILIIPICVDASIRLGLQTFGTLLNFVPMFLLIAKQLAPKPNKVPPTLDGERVYGEIIHSFWVPAGEQNKVALCYLIVQYTFEGVTYQRKYLDHTWGLLATESYLELIVNKENPKEPLSTLSVDYMSRHHQDTGTNTGPLRECFSWVITIVLYMFVALPLFAIPVECHARDLDCTPTVWMDAIFHYLVTLGLIPLYSYSTNDKIKKRQAASAAVALDRIEQPFVPQADDRVIDHSLYNIIPRSQCSQLYLATGIVSFMIWMLYASFEPGILAMYYFYLAGLTLWLAYDWVGIITDYYYLEPIQSKYQEEGILPKNITVLKSGGHATNLTSIIQYYVDVTSSDGYTKTVTAHARITTGDEHKLLILPSEPSTAFVAEAPPPKSWTTIAKLVASPLGLISFYSWKENAGWLEKCIFASITGTLFVISFLCFAVVTVSNKHNPAAGKQGDTVVFLKR